MNERQALMYLSFYIIYIMRQLGMPESKGGEYFL